MQRGVDTAGALGSVQPLHEPPVVTLKIRHGHLGDTMVAGAGRVEFDTGSYKALMNCAHIVDQDPDPGSEPAVPLLPVRHRPVEPHLAIADRQLHIADNVVVIGPVLPFREPEHCDTPVRNGAGIGAEHVRDHTSYGRFDGHTPIVPSPVTVLVRVGGTMWR